MKTEHRDILKSTQRTFSVDQFLETLNGLIDESDLSVVEIVGALSLAQQRVAFDAFIQADSEEDEIEGLDDEL